MATKERKAAKKAPVQRVRDETCRYVYANGVTIATTPYDLQFIFGHAVYEAAKVFVVHEHTVVMMSPEHAKSLHHLLDQRLKLWESQFGEIKVLKDTLIQISKEK